MAIGLGIGSLGTQWPGAGCSNHAKSLLTLNLNARCIPEDAANYIAL